MRTFLVVWSGQLVSQIGTAMSTFALLIWIYERTGRATTVALLGFFWFVPVIALAPLAGVWIDRHDRRRIMLLADAGAAAMTLGVLLLYASGRLEVWHLYIAEAISGVCWAFQGPAYTAATTMLLPSRHYARAAGLRSVATFGADAVAPFLAGVAVVALGIAGVLVIDLVTFLVAVATLVTVRIPRPGKGGPRRDSLGLPRGDARGLPVPPGAARPARAPGDLHRHQPVRGADVLRDPAADDSWHGPCATRSPSQACRARSAPGPLPVAS